MSDEMVPMEKSEMTRADSELTREGRWFKPAVDIYEDDEAVYVEADMPGVRAEDLDIDLRDRHLTLIGGVNPDRPEGRMIYADYELGGFTRQFRVGAEIDPSKISARLNNGVLVLCLPKAEEAKPRKIQIEIGE